MTKESASTKESQYNIIYDVIEKHGRTQLGLMVNESWNQDPKRTLFTLSRYKFVAKMLSGKKNVLEIGCADAFGTRLVQQEVSQVTAVDFDPVFIEDVQSRENALWPLKSFVHDIISGPVAGDFDAAFSLDVFEHIPPADADKFVENLSSSLIDTGVAIIGIPSLESQAYASPQSKAGHVNCMSGSEYKAFLEKHFTHVFMFSMNDEVVHTGFHKMAHYLLAVCIK